MCLRRVELQAAGVRLHAEVAWLQMRGSKGPGQPRACHFEDLMVGDLTQTHLEEALPVFADCFQGRPPRDTSWQKVAHSSFLSYRRAAGEDSSTGGAVSGPRCW